MQAMMSGFAPVGEMRPVAICTYLLTNTWATLWLDYTTLTSNWQLAEGSRQTHLVGLTGYVPSTTSKWGEKYPYSLTNRLPTGIDHSLCSTRLPRIFDDDDSSPIHSHSSTSRSIL